MDDFKRRAELARRFYAGWKRLFREGVCDALDTVECLRVFAEWDTAGRPLPVMTFIREHANTVPEVSS